ncbi:hypothetical protein V8F20_006362 [Naviculisporaceae sp. PSN 640]
MVTASFAIGNACHGPSTPSVTVSTIIALFILPLISASVAHNSTVEYVPDVPNHSSLNITLIPGFSGYSQPSLGRLWPYDANSPEFLGALAKSNATGVYKARGYNVSIPWGEEKFRKPLDGWTFSVAALEIPGPPPRYQDNPVVIGTQTVDVNSTLGFSLTLKAPDSLIKSDDKGNNRVNGHPSWGVCIYVLEPTRMDGSWGSPNNKTLSQDSSCHEYLSNECLQALPSSLDIWHTVAPDPTNPYGSVVKCHYDWVGEASRACSEMWPENRTSADSLFGFGEGEWFNLPSLDGAPIPYLNGSVTMSQVFSVSALAEQYGSSADLSVQDMYRKKWDDMVLSVWPVVTVWMNATLDPQLTVGRDRYRANQKYGPNSNLHCVAPNGIGTGKAFTFSGEVPGTPPAPPSGETGGTGTGGDDGPGQEKMNTGTRRFGFGSWQDFIICMDVGCSLCGNADMSGLVRETKGCIWLQCFARTFLFG